MQFISSRWMNSAYGGICCDFLRFLCCLRGTEKGVKNKRQNASRLRKDTFISAHTPNSYGHMKPMEAMSQQMEVNSSAKTWTVKKDTFLVNSSATVSYFGATVLISMRYFYQSKAQVQGECEANSLKGTFWCKALLLSRYFSSMA